MYGSFVIFCVLILAYDSAEETDRDVTIIDVAEAPPFSPPFPRYIFPGKPIIIQKGHYPDDEPIGEVRYEFNVKEGYGIMASCEDTFRSYSNFDSPCDGFSITFDDGERSKRLCSFESLTETYFMTNKSYLSFYVNYAELGGRTIVRCVIRSTELRPRPSQILIVPQDVMIVSPRRRSFVEDYYLIEGENGQSFNLDCHFEVTENSYCILSRIVIKVEGTEEMFCMSREYRRSNITKAELYVTSDGRGFPMVFCNMTVGYTSAPDTPKISPYGKKSRRDSIKRDEIKKSWTLKAGETKEFGTEDLGDKNVLVYDIDVPVGNKIHVFCNEYIPEYDGTLPCDPFALIMEEEGKDPEYWCSTRNLDSLGYLSDGHHLTLTIENFSSRNRVACAVRSSEKPEPEEVINLKDGMFKAIVVSKEREPYMVKRWIIIHEKEHGPITISCPFELLKSVYVNPQGVETERRQYFCSQRMIQMNGYGQCSSEILINPNLIGTDYGKVDLVIMSDRDGMSGHLCNIEGKRY